LNLSYLALPLLQSFFMPCGLAGSSKGARGLMQLMPALGDISKSLIVLIIKKTLLAYCAETLL